ncbi:Acyl transferase domain-containing protein [Pseudomonas sp. ok272]|uniref:type I polyketide synthase n=1 Tax=unclassified Pseudomonas TaxID=196821 RepID=UPI0008CF5F6D|nr:MULTISPECIES: type I polyketide synthase [unclassified Pseudomonas]SEM99126.1 Acyl transferase domain-containing protein [Pseudomonas sp. ok272]SFM90115.1 Acyl transferase domain-containing protein [Pseudomonas sp. ok602]
MGSKVAIIGASFRFPGSTSATFWQNLLEGRDFITQVDPARWSHDEFFHPDKANPGTSYTFAAGTLGDISTFDAGFFSISPREAAIMDPQQRLLLELGWEVFENAGVKPSSVRGSQCGVYLGIASTDYAYRLSHDLSLVDSSTATGNTLSIAANRLSYIYDLRGPSMAVDTACSSSLVAFHQACQAIQSGEIDQALTGGVSLHLHPFGFLIFSKASMLSRKGRCNVFDEAGDGYVRSEGGGLFYLKDYDKAVADGNPILAVVAGSAVNTDGRKSGLTVPSAEAQAALMTQAYAKAGISPADIDYLEAHGTGTPVGDPIESRAIGLALGQARAADQPLLIGSIKSNIGHLEAASGVAGLMKALYCVTERQVPATIGIKNLNPRIPFAELNLDVVTRNQALKPNGTLVVGVNSFGFGGANAHVILQSHTCEALPAVIPAVSAPVPLMVTAKDSAGLADMAQSIAQHLSDSPAASLYDVAYQTMLRRDLHAQRVVVFSGDPQQSAQALLDFALDPAVPALSSILESGRALDHVKGPVFVFSGNGSQWEGMGRALLGDAVFHAAVSEVDAIFQPLSGYSLIAELAGEYGQDRYQLTEIAQPALFALQVGVTRMLLNQGVVPQVVMGHSVGEVAAAWACGALSLADATRVIYHRSRLQGLTAGSGQMSAVGLSGDDTAKLLQELGLTDVVVAGENSFKGATVAGSVAGLERLEQVLTERQVFVRRLGLDYAFHSPAMDMIAEQVVDALRDIVPRASQIPMYSTVTGGELSGESLGAEYWWQNIRLPVLFQSACETVCQQGYNVFVEVGPHAILRSYVTDALVAQEQQGVMIATLLRDKDAFEQLTRTVAKVLISGVETDLQCLFPHAGRFVRLPNYAWQRERHWHSDTPESSGVLSREAVHPLLGYPVADHALTWDNRLDTQRFPTLADHKVGDAVLFPGAGFTELVIAAAQCYQPGEYVDIEELEIHSPLVLHADSSKHVRVQIDSSDGAISVASRSISQDEPWARHVVARLPGEARGVLLAEPAPVLPTRVPDFTRADHLNMTAAVGLNYGPAYQAIEAGWIDGDQVLAQLIAPSEISEELATLHLHPALLDSAFQLITQLLSRDTKASNGLAFIPVKLGRINFATCSLPPCLAKVRLVRRSEHSLLADFTLYDAQGQAVVSIKDARFRAVKLHKDRSAELKLVDFAGVAKPYPLAARVPALPSSSLHDALVHSLATVIDEPALVRYSLEVDPLLDSLCASFVLEAIEHLGGQLSAAQRQQWQLQALELSGYLDHLLEQAVLDGSLIAGADHWQVADQGERVSSKDIWQELFRSYPEHFQIIHSVGRVGLHLLGLLSGEVKLEALLPRETSPAQLARQVLGASGYQALLDAIKQHIEQRLAVLPAGQRLRILELGFGGVPFAAQLCAQLDFDRVDYQYSATDLEPASLLSAEFPDLKLLALADVAPVSELPGNGFDLVLAATDLAALETISEGLRHSAARLSAGGQLLLLAQHPARWADFVFGAQPAWWLAGQEQQRLSAQQRPGFWQQELRRHGLSVDDALEFLPAMSSGSYVLVGAADSVAPFDPQPLPVQRWLLVADEHGAEGVFARQLTDALRGQGQAVDALAPASAEVMASGLRTGPAPQHVLLLSGLFGTEGLDAQADRCMRAAALAQACEQAGMTPDCWLLTRGAAVHLQPPAGHVNEGLSSLADAALWGFGRTLANEAVGCRVRLLDLGEGAGVEALLPALLNADDETELAISAAGDRYVARLRVRPDQVQDSAEIAHAAQVSLGFELPGQLRNLRWQAHAPRIPAGDQLDIEVHATGLNFRDVMYALGLLSDEAIENGFSGPTLGFEFAGVVRGKGAQVAGDFQPGDRVVGFGPSSFANRLVTNANAVAKIPEGMSFEAAATIPSTFFTVYYALHHLARVEPGEKVLIHGAAGGVGIAAIQIAKWLGAEIYATAGSDEKRDFLRLLGVEHIFDSRSLAFADEILAITDGRGVDVVLNSLAGEAINRNLQVLKPFGRFLELGKRDFYQNTRIGLRPFRNNISYFGIDADQLMSERPELTRRLFGDMMQLFRDGTLSPLPYREFDANDIVESFRYMQQARQIGKIVVTYRTPIQQVFNESAVQSQALQLAADGTYLVTGGLSGFGLRTAQWLVDKGARRLALLGRRGAATEEAQAALTAWREQGIEVQAVACDITDSAQLRSVLVGIEASTAPLRGIVHAATVFDDGLIRNLTQEQLQRVLEPKAKGAQYLHELTAHLALDFFVLYSSATTLFGNPGQANYVAANHWLEALARHRLQQGLPATVVLWGAIDDAGFLARNQEIKDALQSRMGGAALQSQVALDTLEQLLLQKRSGLGVLELEWKALSRFLPAAGAPKFSELARLHNGEQDEESNSDDIQRLLLEMDDPELIELFAEMLKQEISEILRIPTSKLDSSRPLQELGLDSLMSVELVVAVEERFGIRLPVMELSETSSIAKLTVRILELLRGSQDAESAASVDDTVQAMTDETLVRHGAELSEVQRALFSEGVRRPDSETSRLIE